MRLSPQDGHSYEDPAISPDGGFVAYVSDRSGKDELWLQQVGSGDPIQLTYAGETVEDPAFFPDGKRIVYASIRTDETKNTIETISTLGGEPKVLIQGKNSSPRLSPDGRRIAYFDYNQILGRPMTISSDGGRPRELPAWARMPDAPAVTAWTSDSRYLLCMVRKKSEAADAGGFEWFALPVDGGNPVATGAGEALRAAALAPGTPILMTGDRVLFVARTAERSNVWEMRLSPGSWRVQGLRTNSRLEQ
ncbi:MAG: LpqB family beta-propeller domain-containing protein [Bryobacteraceae bacterium]